MQNLAHKHAYAQKETWTTIYLLLLLVCSNFSFTSTQLQAQEPCPNGYVIGDPDNPNGVTWLSQTDLYADFPDGFTGNGDDMGCIHIHGRLRINRDYTFDNATLIMAGKSTIEVRSSKVLRIKNESILQGDDQMWKGINLQGYRSGLDMEHSTIKDAQYAIKAEADVTRLRLLNNTFDANYIGLYASPFVGIIGGKTIEKMSGGNKYFKGNRFVFDSPYLPPYTNQFPSPGDAPYAAIEINDVLYFNIGLPGSDAITNTIENIQYGIINRGGAAGITISINQYSGFHISHPDNLFDNSIGIFIDNTPININITDNYMDRVAVGVRTMKSQKKNIWDNAINSTKQCIFIANEKKGTVRIKDNRLQSEVSEGILIVNCDIKEGDKFNIEDNTLTMLGNSIGISVFDTEGKLNILDGNHIETKYLDEVSNIYNNRGIQLVRTMGPTTIKGNTISSPAPYKTGLGIGIFNSENTHITENKLVGAFSSGIHLAFSPKSLICCNEVPAPQLGGVYIRNFCQDTRVANTVFNGGNGTGMLIVNGRIGEQVNTGNDWTGAPEAAFDAMYIGDSIMTSAFYTDPNLMPNGYDKISAPYGTESTDWFTFEGTDPTCDEWVNCGVEPYLDPEDPTILPYLTDDDLDIIQSTTAVAHSAATKVLNWEGQKYLYRKLSDNPALIDMDDEVAAFYKQAKNGLIGQLYVIEKGIASNQTDGLKAMNNSLSSTTDFQQLEMEINAIYLATVAQGIFIFTDEQKNLINDLADECPYTKGTSVFMARSLKQHYAPGWPWALDECMPETKNEEEKSAEPLPTAKTQWTVFPNPAQSFFTINFHESLSTNTPLSVLDATGKTLVQQTLEEGISETTVDVSHLAPGLYFIEIKLDGQAAMHSRVAVVE